MFPKRVAFSFKNVYHFKRTNRWQFALHVIPQTLIRTSNGIGYKVYSRLSTIVPATIVKSQ